MDRSFAEVFPKLNNENESTRLMEDAVVTRMASGKLRDSVRIYATFPGLVSKRRIHTLEKEIKKNYFQDDNIDVIIIESFTLSEMYTPERAFNDYHDSLLAELYESDRIIYSILKKSKIEFTDINIMKITVPDKGISMHYGDLIESFMSDIMCKRFGFKVDVELVFVEEDINHEALLREEKAIQKQVDSIFNRVDALAEKKSEEDLQKAEDNKANADNYKSFSSSNRGERKTFDKPFKKNFGGDNNGYRFQRSTPAKSDNPDMIFGFEVKGDVMKISDITGSIGNVTIRGKVSEYAEQPLKNGKSTIVSFVLFDGTDSIVCKKFVFNDGILDVQKKLKNGVFVKLSGDAGFDTFLKDVAISIGRQDAAMIIPDFTVKREDNSFEKRVELHCHTKMSDMDGVSTAKDIVEQAIRFGHKAIAITDHGSVQAFPEAYHTAMDNHGKIKVIYGVEAYLVNDEKKIVTNPDGQTLDSRFVVFDIETTGFNSVKDYIIEIGAVKFENGKITDRFSEFVNPGVPIPYRITELTSIDNNMVKDASPIDVILPRFLDFCEGAVLVAHNADFDTSFIRINAERQGLSVPKTYMDTVEMARFVLPSLGRYKLDKVAKVLKVPLLNHHRAVDDAECTAYIFEKLCDDFKNRGCNTVDDIVSIGKMSDEAIMNLHPYHCIILAKNDIGRINLYKLVSTSHLKYFKKNSKLPRSLIEKYREGLIIGSACSAGELYEAVLNGRPEEIIRGIASFYDYLEVQPIGNDQYLIDEDKYDVNSEEDLRDINRRIVALGKAMNKPVVATCDVHFLNPEDEIYRRIIMKGKGFKDAEPQPPLYLHTTEEMLEEFSYLGGDKAREIVIENSNLISDMCEPIAPVRPDKCPPVIANSDEMLRKICYTKAHELYGDDLPDIVVKRLERELNSIISNGYAVMYIIAQKLVWKSVEDGYLVGSRGSVGSSFVATMAGITEVNPLSAHYVCPHCHYVDFDSPEVRSFAGRSGCDMPDKKCPVCGNYLNKDGFDIPFETFLGFKGNKEPDIDLNFSGDYQSKAHRYTEVIFGEGQTFKAGTVGTLADKTAFGYIKKYYEEKNQPKRKCEIDRIVQGCVGVKRTSGQHPGGIIVLPVGEEINTFTPVQHPADDITSDVITTHFDYHSIDSNLLKLDILGHDDPTMIRMLEDLTGLDATKIPLDDNGVMSLFKDTSALEVTPEDLFHCDMGTLGIPEFGTDFAMGLLREAKPQEFSDLIRISGLSHGTDVWQGNAEKLINDGTATISTAICCRDDIMVYLINQGLDPEESFTIMERVRKGVVAKGKCKEWEQYKKDMKEHDVPDWYIWSCELIKYMFPKAHAAAYVMMAWRVAYCKVYYPLAYYAAFFSIRATAFNYEMMCRGEEVLNKYLQEYYDKIEDSKKKGDERGPKLTASEEGTYRDMRIVQEMYARGFDFMPMDIYKSDARYFKIVDGKLLPPFKTIPNMGDKAAETLQIAASQKKFLSKDDLRERGKISKTNIEDMEKLGIIKGLPESNQLSLFDMV